jgi:hypothetical protein
LSRQGVQFGARRLDAIIRPKAKAKPIPPVARQDMQMDVEDLLPGDRAVCQE